MKITNTNSIYLMFLAYLNFTEFEILIMYYCCRPRPTSLFPSEGRFTKIVPFFFFFFFLSVSPGILGLVLTFFLLLLGGGGGGWGSEGKWDSGTPWVIFHFRVTTR